MKRFLLTLVCCSPLVFLPSISYSLDLTGPNDEQSLSYEQYGPITAIETLWGISTKLRPDNSVSVQQTMVAIYKLNPYVFYKGNINQLIPESVIAVPTLEFVRGQTDSEAVALINKYSPRKKAKVIKQQPTPVVPAKTPVKEPLLTESVAQQLQLQNAELMVDKKELVAAENKLDALQSELNAVNEQLLVSTEANQGLKLRLQPLQDELSALKAQLDSELIINTKLQAIIDDYRAQLDAVEALPFSGDGWINELLRLMTSSLTNLIITIISPILLLMAIFVVILRIRSKREFAEQEKELAESTAILMEQAGQFDALLTDDFSGEAEEELDFSDDLETQEADPSDSQEQAINIDEDEIESIDLTDSEDDAFDVVDLTEADESEMSEDDPFGIGALAAREDLISSVDVDDSETDSETQRSKDDPFDISSLVDDDFAADLSADDSKTTSAADQADLDLAAEWEAQLAEDAQGKPNDVVEQEESPVDLTATSEETDDAAILSADSLSDHELEALLAAQENEAESALSAAEVADIEQIPTVDLDEAELEIADADDSLNADEPLEEALTESDSAQAEEVLELDDSLLFDPSALDELIEEQADTEATEEEGADLFAKQLSDSAFNADVPLPKVDGKQKNDFISIETLLDDSDEYAKSEPYTEMDFDLDLNEFPDVINSQGDIDIDDDENGIGAQLDLARAYLEIDDKAGAKEILLPLVELSNGAQRAEIDKLLSRLQ